MNPGGLYLAALAHRAEPELGIPRCEGGKGVLSRGELVEDDSQGEDVALLARRSTRGALRSQVGEAARPGGVEVSIESPREAQVE